MSATESESAPEAGPHEQDDLHAERLSRVTVADDAVGVLENERFEVLQSIRRLDREVENARGSVAVAEAALRRAEADLESQASKYGRPTDEAMDGASRARRDLDIVQEASGEKIKRLRQVKAERESARDKLDMRLSRAIAERENARLALQELQDQRRREAAVALQAELERRREEAAALQAELASMAPVVEAQREALGSSAAVKLAADYEQRAEQHRKQGRVWLGVLAGTVAAVITAVIVLFALNSADAEASASEIVAHLSVNAVVLGMLVFVARVASLQFRAQRHMEEVARNKSAALRTFNRIVAASAEPEVRSTIATVLAQHVFASTDTGLLTDSSSDQVTIVERMIGPLSQRAS